MNKADQKLFNELMKQVVKEPNGCWIWTGGNCAGPTQLDRPYGYVTLGSQKLNVRRLMYRLFDRQPPIEEFALDSTCHRSLCVNPEHLVRSKRRASRGPVGKDLVTFGDLKKIIKDLVREIEHPSENFPKVLKSAKALVKRKKWTRKIEPKQQGKLFNED